ncbi:hypothetical protein [Ovoidimarina sediminis]|uniref:hypothetical protein n=1 Tax=Ovoidimarina sediminis TaxID=3079856 RepID=UPI002908D3B6|nr:hypothetical protein [Rhodophyticola sp. MJ-SS7]MDU8942880.1 hypothetical protein [Rhodophyticola sp. MJ-SS7]
MRTIILAGALACVALPLQADTIRNACLTAPKAGDVNICTCIQAAADRTLSKQDQKLAASFFRDPDRSEEIRRSDTRRHDTFWERYQAFGRMAEAFCS